MANNDFIIQNGVLYEYTGDGGDVVIPDGITIIEENAFFSNTSLTSITIPDSVREIGDFAFAWCTSLTSITIPKSVTYISSSALPASVLSLTVAEGNPGYYSVDNCIIEKKSKTLIAGCKNSIIPSDGSVTAIGYLAFGDCDELTSITIPEGVKILGDEAFNACSSLTSITIPGSVTRIGEEAFEKCTSLTSITIPDGVTRIDDYAFSGCTALTSVTIGNSVTSMGRNVFGSGKNLIVHTPAGSYAEKYCKDCGIQFDNNVNPKEKTIMANNDFGSQERDKYKGIEFVKENGVEIIRVFYTAGEEEEFADLDLTNDFLDYYDFEHALFSFEDGEGDDDEMADEVNQEWAENFFCDIASDITDWLKDENIETPEDEDQIYYDLQAAARRYLNLDENWNRKE